MDNNKWLGIVSIILGGVIFIVSYFVVGFPKLVDYQAHSWLGKYVILVAVLNGAAYFLITGALIILGKVQPYFTALSEIDLSKNYLVSFFILLPLLSFFFIEFVFGGYVFYKKLIFIVLIIYLIYKAYRSSKYLIENRE